MPLRDKLVPSVDLKIPDTRQACFPECSGIRSCSGAPFERDGVRTYVGKALFDTARTISWRGIFVRVHSDPFAKRSAHGVGFLRIARLCFSLHRAQGLDDGLWWSTLAFSFRKVPFSLRVLTLHGCTHLLFQCLRATLTPKDFVTIIDEDIQQLHQDVRPDI